MAYEKLDTITGERFAWNQKESLEELAAPERMKEIWEKHAKVVRPASTGKPSDSLFNVLGAGLDEEHDTEACTIYSL
jgi:hypothetical protein